MRVLKALIFNADGTLAETAEVHRMACNMAFQTLKLGFVWDQPLYRDLATVSGGRERIEYYLERYRPEGFEAALARLDEIHTEKNRRYLKLIDEQAARLRTGVDRLVSEARTRGVRLAIATSTTRGNVEGLLMAGLDFDGMEAFDVIVAGDMVARKKPAPDVYLEVLRQLGLPARHCLAIEDGRAGLEAASAAGIRTLVTPSFYTKGDEFPGAFAVLSDLGDPFEPYEHIAGAGDDGRVVTIAALERWMRDDDDMRALLTLGGRPVIE
ncbi:HAD-IA family hydrolase [Methylobrevis pamukkalensis]|uniref:Phosphorylated carbohydrates phosphatase n=1 Tax=Methylobrevis pamukkalensis TaxID=1439726 RepID=A0A1E3H0R2_9HYPH|nr:HAD-IA family hydrolase [Methylobrevis pamukkalensis]ODN69928.1 Phosphorylated carbohydrates phosphatase [Methylobrevis pamukkalensis]